MLLTPTLLETRAFCQSSTATQVEEVQEGQEAQAQVSEPLTQSDTQVTGSFSALSKQERIGHGYQRPRGIGREQQAVTTIAYQDQHPDAKPEWCPSEHHLQG
jgi:hypothetical protein